MGCQESLCKNQRLSTHSERGRAIEGERERERERERGRKGWKGWRRDGGTRDRREDDRKGRRAGGIMIARRKHTYYQVKIY